MELALLCRELADNKKAEDITILDLRQLHGVTDFMVLCTGTSDPHLRAVKEEISWKLRDEHQIRPRAVDGTRHSGWIVLDFVDVLVHVMKRDTRERYDLEGLWNDAPKVGVPEPKATKKKEKAARKTAAKKKAAKSATPRKSTRGVAASGSKAKTKAKTKAKAGAKPATDSDGGAGDADA
ncbi:MAG: ribosome silencing factor [Limisphaerales bacterium]